MASDADVRYACMWVPLNGLFLRGAYFTDGDGCRIPWDKTIHLFRSKDRAEQSARITKAKYPVARGEVVVVAVVVNEVEGEQTDGE